ncbi:MAG: 3-dehydroquinate synthase, partial [Candidatus Kerfeldbacteria bacterium]|nr:3-dehydroquinate synthase [Candidatus Kerfeldbacteria bacterium]
LPQVKRLFKDFPIIVLPNGEQHKRLSTVEWACNELIKLGADRQTVLIGVGGGIVGDMVGLIANLFMRGIQFYLLPTTLLAMVDSSIGGKTGVDLPSGKNLVGTFYPPTAVVVNPIFLKTLPAVEFSNGMAEVIKHGILDKTLFHWLEQNAKKIKQRNSLVLAKMIRMNVAIKTAIVKADEREQQQRMLLNLGHTFGHAFELLSDYTLPHGQAVAIGLAYATAYSQMPERNRVLALLREFDLPTTLAKPYPPDQIVKAMLADKKHRGQTITLVLPQRLGQIRIERGVTITQVVKFLKRYQA